MSNHMFRSLRQLTIRSESENPTGTNTAYSKVQTLTSTCTSFQRDLLRLRECSSSETGFEGIHRIGIATRSRNRILPRGTGNMSRIMLMLNRKLSSQSLHALEGKESKARNTLRF